MMTSSMFTDAAQSVARKMSGAFTKEETIRRYFGLTVNEMNKAEKLKKMGIAHSQRLQELGVSIDDMKKVFEDVLPNDYFDGNKKGKSEESSDSVTIGSEGTSSVDSPKRRTKRNTQE